MATKSDFDVLLKFHKNCPEVTLDGPCDFCRALDRMEGERRLLQQERDNAESARVPLEVEVEHLRAALRAAEQEFNAGRFIALEDIARSALHREEADDS